MSQENVALIRRSFAALNRGDVLAAKALADPACEIRSLITGLAGRTYRGHAGVEQYFADLTDVGYPPLSEMSELQRREFHEALLEAATFEDLSGE